MLSALISRQHSAYIAAVAPGMQREIFLCTLYIVKCVIDKKSSVGDFHFHFTAFRVHRRLLSLNFFFSSLLGCFDVYTFYIAPKRRRNWSTFFSLSRSVRSLDRQPFELAEPHRSIQTTSGGRFFCESDSFSI